MPLTLAPLLPATDPVFLQIFPGASLLTATVVTSFASIFGIYLTASRHGRWWALGAVLLALTTNTLSLTTVLAVAFSR